MEADKALTCEMVLWSGKPGFWINIKELAGSSGPLLSIQCRPPPRANFKATWLWSCDVKTNRNLWRTLKLFTVPTHTFTESKQYMCGIRCVECQTHLIWSSYLLISMSGIIINDCINCHCSTKHLFFSQVQLFSCPQELNTVQCFQQNRHTAAGFFPCFGK